MLSGRDNFEAVIVVAGEPADEPSEAELKLVLQFLPDIYRDMLRCIEDDKEK